MFMRREYYKSTDGSHFPDTNLGEELYYGISFDCWITNENDSMVSVEWVIPDELESQDNYTQENVAYVKLKSLAVGTFQVSCVINTIEAGKTQKRIVPMRLKVF